MTTDDGLTPEAPQTPYQPTLHDLLMLESPVGVRVSPDGTRVAILVRSTDWQEDRYEVSCHIHDLATGLTLPLTRTGSVSQAEWVDSRTLALLWDGPNSWDGAQVYVFEGLTGEGWQVTHHEDGVNWFMPFAGGILYRADGAKRDELESREQHYGHYTHFEQEPSTSAVYYMGLPELRAYEMRKKAPSESKAKPPVEPVIEISKLLEEPLSIRDVVIAPAHDAIYLFCRKRDDLVYYRDTSNFRISLDARAALAEHLRRETAAPEPKPSAEGEEPPDKPGEEKKDVSYLGEIAKLALPGGAHVTAVSPDGRTLLVEHQGRDEKMYTRVDLWLIDTGAALAAPDPDTFVAAMRNLTAPLDRAVFDGQWAPSGIYFAYADGTAMRIGRADSAGSEPQGLFTLDLGGLHPSARMHVSRSGVMAFLGTDATSPEEVYVAEPAPSAESIAGAAPEVGIEAPSGAWHPQVEPWRVRRVSDFGASMEGWDMGTVETIEWPSHDGTIIQGVLRKPSNFDPTHRYPLVLVVHGGPTWFSEAILLTSEDVRYYPSVQFVNKGVLVLKPNYRGSIGRGQAFQELNVNNLGVGDLWDIESGVEYLVAQGWADPERVGCMGWSQGGYISAFAGLHSGAFRAVSVGAGISDWYTYHVSNDIPDFTIDYLSGSPFRDRDLYARSAPMSNIANAKTPMLIQHGAEDRRVPISNAMELYRGLKAMNVPVELFVFPGMGHPITRPRENHAVMHQNLAWFSHYLLDEELKLE